MSFAKAPRFREGHAATPGPGQYQAKFSSMSGPKYTFGKPKSTRRATELPKLHQAQLKLVAELGRGGLATVHRARFCGKAVAVKLYRCQPGLGNPEQDREGLHKEALLLAGLSHTNIVRALFLVTDRGVVTGFGLELLGQSLQAAARNGQLTAQRLASAVAPTCEALAYLHQRPIAHLDVKPANICFTAQLSVKLVDMDAAMTMDHPDELTRRLPGNLADLSPEIVNKMPYNPLKEDCWQAGCTFTTLIQETQVMRDEVLLVRLRPLLGRAESRPSMQKFLDENLQQSEAAIRQQLQREGLPALLWSRPQPQNPLLKLFG